MTRAVAAAMLVMLVATLSVAGTVAIGPPGYGAPHNEPFSDVHPPVPGDVITVEVTQGSSHQAEVTNLTDQAIRFHMVEFGTATFQAPGIDTSWGPITDDGVEAIVLPDTVVIVGSVVYPISSGLLFVNDAAAVKQWNAGAPFTVDYTDDLFIITISGADERGTWCETRMGRGDELMFIIPPGDRGGLIIVRTMNWIYEGTIDAAGQLSVGGDTTGSTP